MSRAHGPGICIGLRQSEGYLLICGHSVEILNHFTLECAPGSCSLPTSLRKDFDSWVPGSPGHPAFPSPPLPNPFSPLLPQTPPLKPGGLGLGTGREGLGHPGMGNGSGHLRTGLGVSSQRLGGVGVGAVLLPTCDPDVGYVPM